MIGRGILALVVSTTFFAAVAVAQQTTPPKDEPKKDTSETKPAAKLEKATFGGGCFWCLEAVYERFNGVKSVVSGYAGGSTRRPTYASVSTGTTGHAEVIQIEFDPAVISYQDLLDVFFACHDPTTLNRQGPDEGTQYRSIILYHDELQRQLAQKTLQRLNYAGLYIAPIVTQVVPMNGFTAAEKYHQDYYRKNRNAPYCQMYITPKFQELQFKLQKVGKVTKGP